MEDYHVDIQLTRNQRDGHYTVVSLSLTEVHDSV